MVDVAGSAPPGRCIVRIRMPSGWRPWPSSSPASAAPTPARWTAEEDARLERLAKENGFRHWHRVARQMPGRSPRFCRARWRDHLARHVYHRPFTAGDGSRGRWKQIGSAVYGRTSRVMKRRWKELRIRSDKNIFNCPLAPPSSPQQQQEQEGLELHRWGCAEDVLASSFASCSLATTAAVDPRAGSLALGFACMAV